MREILYVRRRIPCYFLLQLTQALLQAGQSPMMLAEEVGLAQHLEVIMSV